MMSFWSILIWNAILQMNVPAGGIDLDYVRSNYNKAVANKNLCARMIEDLKPVKSEPLYLAYLGGLQAIWANHVVNPIAKLNTFREGRKNIEKAVLKEPNNVEVRFIRFSIKKNAPFFLGYYSNIKSDKDFLKMHRNEITSRTVLKNIDEALKDF